MILLEQNKVHGLSNDELNRIAGESIDKLCKKLICTTGFIQTIEIEPHLANAGYDLYYTARLDGTLSTGADTVQEAIIDFAFKLGIELYTNEFCT